MTNNMMDIHHVNSGYRNYSTILGMFLSIKYLQNDGIGRLTAANNAVALIASNIFSFIHELSVCVIELFLRVVRVKLSKLAHY
jgi:hypothetical protein